MAGTPEELAPDDAHILALESDSITGHTLKLIMLEAGSQPLDLEALRTSVAERLATTPRALQRVVRDAAGAPCWAECEDFDVAAHVRRLELGSGADEAELWRTAGELMSQRLDHDRPLWAFDVVGPLADGREAIVVRVHHAMADGISTVRFCGSVLWHAVAERAAAPRKRTAAAAVESAEKHHRLDELRRLPGALHRELGGHAQESPLDRPVGSARELAFVAIPLADLKAIGASRPGHVTVNDVLLAVVAGGLREWLGAAGGLPALRAQIPVSLHHRSEGAGELGNRDSFLNVDLPLGEAEPIARLDRIQAETEERKRLGDAEELYDFFHALARFKHLDRAVEHLAAEPREFSLSISNVPGPRDEIAVAGRRVERLASVAEPADRHALRVSALSCARTVGVGLCTDPDALPDVAGLAAALERAADELRAAAGIE
jgi:WS/DGAT/MGAT family acyltransferase